VAAEAATALGELKDRRARLVLPHVVQTTGGELRMRAAIALARVDRPEATPALIETLLSDNWELQNRATHYLGFVGDRGAIDPLLAVAGQSHLRSRVCLALGRLGRRHPDPRILPFLLRMVRTDRHQDVRQRALAGIGYLGDRRAAAPLGQLLARDTGLSWLPETLSRLGGLGRKGTPGMDLAPDARRRLRRGWGACHRGRSVSAEKYLGQTWCAVDEAAASLDLHLRRRLEDPTLVLRLRPLWRRLEGRELRVVVNGRALAAVTLARGWQVVRLPTKQASWRAGRNRISLRLDTGRGKPALPPGGMMAVDYLLLAPAPPD